MPSVYIEIALEDQGEEEINDFIEDIKKVTEGHCGFVIDINKQ